MQIVPTIRTILDSTVMGMCGAMDGSPDDQIILARGPDCLHVLGVVVGPTRTHITNFIAALKAGTGKDNFELQKWSGSSDSYKSLFIKGIKIALFKTREVKIFVFSNTAELISKLWGVFIKQNKLESWVKESPDRKKVTWGPYNFFRGHIEENNIIKVDAKKSAVLAWEAISLTEIYGGAFRAVGSPPEWHILCDRLPGDPNGRLLQVLVNLLNANDGMRGRISLEFSTIRGGKDSDFDILSDCIATWTHDFLSGTSLHGSALHTIFEDALLTTRFHLRQHREDKKWKYGRSFWEDDDT